MRRKGALRQMRRLFNSKPVLKCNSLLISFVSVVIVSRFGILSTIVACLRNVSILDTNSLIYTQPSARRAVPLFFAASIAKLATPQINPHVSNCHFCNPPLCPSFVGADLLAILTSAVFMYSCARLAQTFLWALVSAFLQSREQYRTLLHEMQGLSEGLSESEEDSGLEHFAHVSVGASGKVLGPAVKDLVLRRTW